MKYTWSFVCSAACAGALLAAEGPAADPAAVVDPSSGVIRYTGARMHDKERTQPYPREHHVLYLNPPPLLVPLKAIYPDGKKNGTQLVTFQLSRDAAFKSADTITSDAKPWAVFNAHRELEPGVWFWRYGLSTTGNSVKWAEPQHFTVSETTARFATPPFGQLLAGIPKDHPRLSLYLDSLRDGRTSEQLKQNPEYAALVSKAKPLLAKKYVPVAKLNCDAFSKEVDGLYQAYVITKDPAYQKAMISAAKVLMALSPAEAERGSGFWMDPMAQILDSCYDQLEPAFRTQMIDRLCDVAKKEFLGFIIKEEDHIKDNHFWQWELRQFTDAALVLLNHKPEARDMVAYCYEVYTSRAPQMGFNLDGNWVNGDGYYTVNMLTLHHLPSLFGRYANFDYYKHPWFQKAGRALVYSLPPKTASDGFGDGHEKSEKPYRTHAAWTDYLAREYQIPYAGWYAQQSDATGSQLHGDYLMRPYRILRDTKYPATLPADAPNAVVFKDSGVAELHSDIRNYTNNLFVSFRSSPFGSGSHTLADQNSFNLSYKGKPIFRASGHYLNFSDAHNLMSYRHTRAHNSVLVDGIGQPFSIDGYGWIARFSDTASIAYALGDASMAYRGASEDPMWIGSFKKDGIEQTPANGFGPTPLNLFRRHLVLLRPNIVVLYDELGADRPARFDWLLHSGLEMKAEDEGVSVESPEAKARLAQLSGEPIKRAITTGYLVPPNEALLKDGDTIDPVWHLTASTEPTKKTYILSVIVVDDRGAQATPLRTAQDSGTIQAGEWTIQAELKGSKPARLLITNKEGDKALAYAVPQVVVDSQPFKASYTQSTLIYDRQGGNKAGAIELIDTLPRTSY